MTNLRFITSWLHSLTIISLSILFSQNAHAFPLISMAPHNSDISLKRRNNNLNSSTSISAQVWVPILVIVFVLALATIWTCTKKRWWGHMGHMSIFGWGTTATDAAPAQGSRELTAEQLAGSINANATTTTGRNRRNRRPRRTPSQISTTSLPAYNKEPGEQELVIFRGPEDMEDAPMPTAVVMPSVSEDGEDSMHSRDDSDSYTPMPDSPNNEPLLEENSSSRDQPMPSLQDSTPRRSVGTLNSDEASSLMRVNDDTPAYTDIPRGEAPAYFEAVDVAEDLAQNNGPSRETLTQPSPAPPPPERAPARRSGFRQLLSALPNRLSMSHNASNAHSSHNRAESSISLVSSENSHGRETSHNLTSHRPSASGSGSLLSLAPFRTISRQSNVNLNSPSMISLDSISAPLSHTLIRTEFTYPKSGPTPEQLKLISSREAFARFGMPYGADAIAYAASASRHDLDVPPPGFDDSASEIPPLPSSPQPGPSRLRAISNAEDLAQEQVREVMPVPLQGTHSPVPSDSQLARPSSPADKVLANHTDKKENTPSLEPASENIHNIDNSATPTTLSDDLPSNSYSVDAVPPSSYKAPNTTTLDESRANLAIHSKASAGLGLGAQPHKVSSIYDRSASRASSVQTFATAAESMHTESSQMDSDPDVGHSEPSVPTTPRVTVRSVLPNATVAASASNEAAHAI